MALYPTNITEGKKSKSALSPVNIASHASGTNVGHDALLPTLSVLPNELLIEILAHTLASKVPFHLQEFIELGKINQTRPFKEKSRRYGPRDWFFCSLPSSQREHYLDWLAVNGISRRFRLCGKLTFFSEKVFIIAPPLSKALQDGRCKNISAADKAAIFSRVRHVIAPLPAIGMASYFTRLSNYNAFTCIRILSIQPHVSDRTDLPLLVLDIASTPMASQPLQMGDGIRDRPINILKRHPAPQKLLTLLEGVGLQVGRMEVNLIYPNTENSRQRIIDEFTNEVYPCLRFIGQQNLKRRVAEDLRSSASV